MSDLIRRICLFSILCSVTEMLISESSAKQAVKILNTTIAAIMIISFIMTLDMSVLADTIADINSRQSEISASSAETADRLKRMVIQQEAEEYIITRASELGIYPQSVHVDAVWSAGAYWVPYKAVIYCKDGSTEKLSQIIEAELGISAERQEWHSEGEADGAD